MVKPVVLVKPAMLRWERLEKQCGTVVIIDLKNHGLPARKGYGHGSR